MTGTLERGTEGGLFLVPCGTQTAIRLRDPEGNLDRAGAFASVYVGRVDQDGREAWSVRRINYIPQEGFGCGFDWNGTLWRAAGNEPFWSAAITEDGLSLRFPERDIITIPVRVEPGPLFKGDNVTLQFTGTKCVDTMAGTDYGWVTVLERNGQVFQGCGFQGMAGQTGRP